MSKLSILLIVLLFIGGCGGSSGTRTSSPQPISNTNLYVDIKDSDTNQSIEEDSNHTIYNDNNNSNPRDDNNNEPCYIDSNSDNNSNNCNDNNITPQWPMDNNFNSGNDNNNTTPNWPSDDNESNAEKLRTISQAIEIAEKEDISAIYIAEGNYTEENGEEFPIVVPKGLTLLSDSANAVVNIIGAGETDSGNLATIVLKGDNRIKNINISSNDNVGIISEDGNNTLTEVLLIENKNGINIKGNSKVKIIDSNITNNTNIGIELSQNAIITLLNSVISNNEVGIYISDNSKIDPSSKNSKIIQNRQCDLFSNGTQDLILSGIEWDDSVFDFNITTECINGNNIVNRGEGTIIYQIIPTTDLLFVDAENEIKIISPQLGETIYTTEPTIKYENLKYGDYIMVTIWKKIPKINDENKTIINREDIVWYWHSGMGKGSGQNIIEYNLGATPLEGGIVEEDGIIPPLPLQKGRTYYLAIWEWDEKAINIISSSKVYYFHISP